MALEGPVLHEAMMCVISLFLDDTSSTFLKIVLGSHGPYLQTSWLN